MSTIAHKKASARQTPRLRLWPVAALALLLALSSAEGLALGLSSAAGLAQGPASGAGAPGSAGAGVGYAIRNTQHVITYTYDAAGRLTGADYGDDTAITYTYDAAGNLLQREVTGATATPTPTATPTAATPTPTATPTATATATPAVLRCYLPLIMR